MHKKLIYLILAFIIFGPLSSLFSKEVSVQKKNYKDLIQGRVVQRFNDNPIPNARLAVKGTVFYTYTNKKGEFAFRKEIFTLLNIKNEAVTIIVSKEGFITKRVTLSEFQTPFQIKMDPKLIKIGQMEEIVVTASGMDVTGYSTPYATNIMVSEEIFNKDIENINKVINEVPSVAMVGNDHHAAPSIRGLARKRVIVTVDGIRMPSHRSVGAYVSFINPYNVETIEIIKGPFSVIYGSDAMGGVINITTKESHYYGNKFKINGGVSCGYGSVNDGFNLNIHLDSGVKDFNLVLSAGKRKGGNYKMGNGNEMLDSFYEESYVNFKSELLLGKNHKINFIHLRTDGNDIGKPTGDSNKTTKHPDDDHNIFAFNYIWNNISPIFHSFEVTLSKSGYTLTGDFTNIKGNKFTRTARDLGGDDYNIFMKGTMITSPKLILNFGFDGYFQENQHIRGRKDIYNKENMELIKSTELNEVPDAYTRNYGFFAQGIYNPTERLSFNFGIRRDIIGGKVNRENETVQTDDTALNGNFGFIYELNSFMRLAGSIGTAYRIPSVKEMYFIGQTPQGMNYGNPDLDPERSINLDLNLKFKLEKANKFNFFSTISYFKNYIKNLINLKWSQPSGDRIGIFENIGHARIHGLELDANLSIKGGWFFSSTFATLKGIDVESDEILMDIAPIQWNFNLKKFFGKGNYWLGFHIRYSVKETDVAEGDAPTDEFTLFDAMVGANLYKQVKLRFSISNLFNTEYREFFNLVNVCGRGRSFQTSLEFRF